jgi:hypothetical protein
MTDQQEYKAAESEYVKIKIFLEKPRCINCDNWTAGHCGHYGPVPESHWYTPTECDKWMVQIPF